MTQQKMEEKRMKVYDILMNTPLGKKKGELKAKIENGKLTGFLSLFGNTEPIEGTVDESGKCSLKGKFITLMKSVDFTADGTIDPDIVRLALKGGDCSYYEVIGMLRKQGGHDN